MNHLGMAICLAVACFAIGGALDESAKLAAEQQAASDYEDAELALSESPYHGRAALDHEGKVIYWNPAMEVLTGWLEADMVGKTLEHAMPAAFWQRHQTAFLTAINSIQRGERQYLRKTIEVNCVLNHKDKEKGTVEFSGRVRMVISRKTRLPYGIAAFDRADRIIKPADAAARG